MQVMNKYQSHMYHCLFEQGHTFQAMIVQKKYKTKHKSISKRHERNITKHVQGCVFQVSKQKLNQFTGEMYIRSQKLIAHNHIIQVTWSHVSKSALTYQTEKYKKTQSKNKTWNQVILDKACIKVFRIPIMNIYKDESKETCCVWSMIQHDTLQSCYVL